jgi:peptidoglycan/xylan/chitin deacetylase (PgdA/CDA1 family)
MIKSALIRIAEIFGLLYLVRFLNRQRPIVLMYHRIVRDPLLPGISPEVFAEQLEYIKNRFRVVPMHQLALEIETNTIKPYTLALTFDDGHSDFYTDAWPLLKQFELPAALYVTTGFVDRKCWLWPDLLRYILINSKSKILDLSGIGSFSLMPEKVLDSWNDLGDHCLRLDAETRWKFLFQLAQDLGVEVDSSPRAPFAPVTWDQLREMQSEGLEIGSHSVTHPILSHLKSDALTQELIESRKRIEEELSVTPKGICYPNGMAQDISPEVETQSHLTYRYGLVAYPGGLDKSKIMRLGRWVGADNLSRFKQILNHLSRNDNNHGEYR